MKRHLLILELDASDDGQWGWRIENVVYDTNFDAFDGGEIRVCNMNM